MLDKSLALFSHVYIRGQGYQIKIWILWKKLDLCFCFCSNNKFWEKYLSLTQKSHVHVDDNKNDFYCKFWLLIKFQSFPYNKHDIYFCQKWAKIASEGQFCHTLHLPARMTCLTVNGFWHFGTNITAPFCSFLSHFLALCFDFFVDSGTKSPGLNMIYINFLWK